MHGRKFEVHVHVVDHHSERVYGGKRDRNSPYSVGIPLPPRVPRMSTNWGSARDLLFSWHADGAGDPLLTAAVLQGWGGWGKAVRDAETA